MNISQTLVASFCLSICAGIAGAQSSTASASTVLLSGFEAPLSAEWNATANNRVPLELETAPALVKEGKSSALWKNVQHNAWVSITSVPADWSGYEAVSIWIHSAVANGQVINFTVTSPNNNQGGDYYVYPLTIDWTGWKQILMPFDLFKKNRSPKGWNAIAGFQIASKGWGGVQPLPDTVLHLDQLQLVRR